MLGILESSSWIRFSLSTNLFLTIATISLFLDNSAAKQCYRCAVTTETVFIANDTIVTHMCSKFDGSEKYEANCPFSSMCLKTISVIHLQNGQKQETVTRGCAPQKSTTQVFRDRQWHQEHSIEEVYHEGCTKTDESSLIGSSKTLCYCRGDLCNSGKRNVNLPTFYTKIFAVILFTYMCIKYSYRL